MNAPAFTKGPWVAAGPNDISNATVGIHADDFIIADMCDDVPDWFDQHANARLIAAAPDGYAFAESFLAWLEQLRKIRAPKDLLPGLEAREREARAFLAKAQGGAA